MTDRPLTEPEARALVELILRYARAHDFAALLRIALEPTTEPALDLLPPKATATARIQLEGAFKWREGQFERTSERLDEVRNALDAYDLTLARGILRRVETAYISEGDRDRFDQLILETESRAMEAEELAEVVESIVPTPPPPQKPRV
jgi:hypothetical protein